MKGAAIFLICAIVFVLGDEINDDPSQAAAICAVEDSDGVLVAHEHCNKFYKCSEGKPVALSCQPGLLYSPINKWCDWPYKVDCGNRIIPDEDSDSGDGGNGGEGGGGGGGGGGGNEEINDDPSQAPAICSIEGSDGVLVAHEYCNKFYKCSEGVPVALKCQPGLLYSPINKWCDWPYKVDCGNRIIPDEDSDSGDGGSGGEGGGGGAGGGGGGGGGNEEINDDPSQASAICSIEGSDGVLVAHEYCNKFYKCSEGVPVALKCQPGLLYSPINKWCDWPYKVDCGNRIIPDEDSDSGDGGSGGEGGGGGAGGGGGGGGGNEEINDDPSQASAICSIEGSDGVLVAHEYCNKFYKCSEGVPVALKCQPGLLYSPINKWCDWPYKVDCGNRIIPDEDSDSGDGGSGAEGGGGGDGGGGGGGGGNEEINDDPSQAPAICSIEGSDGVLVAHEYCNKFYKCSEGVPVALECQPGLLYSPINKWCDWPRNVNCGDRLIPGEGNGNNNKPGGDDSGNDFAVADEPNDVVNDDPSQAPTICSAQDSNGILVAHEHCNKFYKCFEGAPVTLRCPAGLLYSPIKLWCDWPYKVNCGDRIIPDEDTDGPDGGGDGDDKPSEVVNDDPSQAPAICAAEGSNGILIAHEYCNRFYQCFDGVPVPLRCRPGFFYNPITTWCDSPENVDCGNRKIINDDNDNTNNPGDGGGGNDEAGRPVDEVNDDPSQAPAICAAKDSDGILVAHEYCNKFYKCFEGIPVARRCPAGLLYNPKREWCDWPYNVNCGNRIIPDEDVDSPDGGGDGDDKPSEVVNDDPSQAPAICAAEGSNGILIAHEYCNRFYQCFDGVPVPLRCRPGFFYNPITTWCDSPENVDCGNRKIIVDDNDNTNNPGGGGGGNDEAGRPVDEVNDDPSKAPAICAAPESEGVMVAHEYCNQFYKCSGTVPVVLYCPGTLLYNPLREWCDWPRNVNCGDRIIPENS